MMTNHAKNISNIHFKNKRIARATGTPDAKAVTPKHEPVTVAELKAQAKEAGIKGYSTMKKADLLKALA